MFHTTLNNKLLAHWQSLVDDRGPSTCSDFLANFDAELQPWLFICELKDANDMWIRLMATKVAALWGHDLTGMPISQVFDPHRVKLSVELTQELVRAKCGMVDTTRCMFDDGTMFEMENMSLPFRPAFGENPKIVTTTAPEDTLDLRRYEGQRPTIIERKDRRWVDVGFGVSPLSIDRSFTYTTPVEVTREAPVTKA